MADNEMDSWDEEEEKEWQEQQAKGYNEARYRKEQQRRAASDLRKYRNNYPDRPKVNPCQEKSLHKIQYKGTMWFLMWFQRLTPRLVMRLLKFLLTSLASVYRCLCPCDKSGTLPEMQNLDFYLNKKRFKPNGEFIEGILNQWKDDYELLERNHSYIQWLFPLQEQGMNYRARMLTKTEIEMMKKDQEVQRRFIEAYKLMLGFYGINLVTEATGEVKRAEKFEERFDNLDYHSHNNLRITRILKCLGELGFEHYQAPLVKFFLVETLVEKQLPGVKNSVLDYFMFTVKDKQQRRDLVHFAWENYEPRSRFIWGPIEQLKKYKKPSDCDSDVGGETGGKENMAKTQEAEKRCGEHGDGKHQVGGDDDDGKISSHVGIAHDLESQKKEKLDEEQSGNNEPNGKNVVESQGEQRTLDWNVVEGRGDEEKEHSKEEEGKESIRSTDNYDDAVSGTDNTQIEGSSVDGDDEKTECIEQKVESPRRLEEDNVTEVTQLKAENECELSSSKKESESQDGSDLVAGSAGCQNEENESTAPEDEEETNMSNDDKWESSGGLDSDDKKTGPKMDGRKRKMKGNRTDGLTQLESSSDDELSNNLTENCNILPMRSVKTGKTDDKDEAKKVKLESNSNGDSGNGERDPDESEVLLEEPPHQMNVKQDLRQDTDGGRQTNSYL